MCRRLVIVLLALGPLAHADGACKTVPGQRALRALAVTLTDGAFVASSVGAFPAVSADGSTLVELFDDAEDFTGFPITTLVFWSASSGTQLDTFALAPPRSGAPEDQIRRDNAASLAKANARLATTMWRGATTYTPCGTDGEKLQIAGVTITFSRDKQEVRVGRASPVRFSPPGERDRDVDVGGGGGCGQTIGFARAFGAGKLVVIVPQVQLGGDSCTGIPSAELALAIRLR